MNDWLLTPVSLVTGESFSIDDSSKFLQVQRRQQKFLFEKHQFEENQSALFEKVPVRTEAVELKPSAERRSKQQKGNEFVLRPFLVLRPFIFILCTAGIQVFAGS